MYLTDTAMLWQIQPCFEYFAQVFHMIFHTVAIDDDVVQVNNHKLVQVSVEQFVHQGAERRRRIRQAKGHNQPLECTIAHYTGYLGFITFGNPNLVITLSQVHLRKHLGLSQSVKQVSN